MISAMVKRLCTECHRFCWHNVRAKSKDSAGGYRCTFCGYPLGTGPKHDRDEPMHRRQLAQRKL